MGGPLLNPLAGKKFTPSPRLRPGTETSRGKGDTPVWVMIRANYKLLVGDSVVACFSEHIAKRF